MNLDDGKTDSFFRILGAGFKYNSAYSATQLMSDVQLLYGSALGVVSFGPAEDKKEANTVHAHYGTYVLQEDGSYKAYYPPNGIFQK